MVPVVNDPLTETKDQAVPVVGFIGLHVVAVVGNGANSLIQVYFDPSIYANLTAGIGPNYGAYQPPTLVQ